ncbi:helix-turn-helix domain-containing protein [Pseudomonas aeruginosa]
MARARELLAARLLDPPSLEELAAAVNLSPFHFARSSVAPPACRPTPGSGQRRLEQARALLKSGRAPLEVALELGFADQSHLGRQFARPTAWHRVNTAWPARAHP